MMDDWGTPLRKFVLNFLELQTRSGKIYRYEISSRPKALRKANPKFVLVCADDENN